MVGVVFDQVSVSVPVGVIVIASRVHLYEAYAAFNKATSKKAFATKVFGARAVNAIEFLYMFGFGVEVYGFGSGSLHLVSEFVGGDAGGEIGVVVSLGEVPFVYCPQVIKQGALLGAGDSMRIF